MRAALVLVHDREEGAMVSWLAGFGRGLFAVLGLSVLEHRLAGCCLWHFSERSCCLMLFLLILAPQYWQSTLGAGVAVETGASETAGAGAAAESGAGETAGAGREVGCGEAAAEASGEDACGEAGATNSSSSSCHCGHPRPAVGSLILWPGALSSSPGSY